MSISNYLDSVAKPFEGLAPWILRLVLGVSFILHGLGKFPLPPEKMVGDMKGMEKMLKPALEKFMQESGFVKESELRKLEKRVEELEAKLRD